eukprot:SAG11_NODE_2672_length_3110_cov_2.425108_4_plen_130_part_00
MQMALTMSQVRAIVWQLILCRRELRGTSDGDQQQPFMEDTTPLDVVDADENFPPLAGGEMALNYVPTGTVRKQCDHQYGAEFSAEESINIVEGISLETMESVNSELRQEYDSSLASQPQHLHTRSEGVN